MDDLARAACARRARTFQCRDSLWQSLEETAGELECSVDYLVNEALKHYIRHRLTRHPRPDPPSAPGVDTLPTTPPPSLPSTHAGPYPPAPPPLRANLLRPPPPPPLHLAPPAVPPPPPPARMTPPPLPPRTAALRPAAAMPRAPSHSSRALPPPPLPRQLAVTCADRTAIVDRPAFVIGRSKAAGLVIRDPNISRQHAIIEQQGGLYYLVDTGSVNGTFVNGARIARRAIAEGDVARVCDHELRFTFVDPPVG